MISLHLYNIIDLYYFADYMDKDGKLSELSTSSCYDYSCTTLGFSSSTDKLPLGRELRAFLFISCGQHLTFPTFRSYVLAGNAVAISYSSTLPMICRRKTEFFILLVACNLPYVLVRTSDLVSHSAGSAERAPKWSIVLRAFRAP